MAAELMPAFVGTGQQEAPHVLRAPYPAANGEWQENPRRRAVHHVEDCVAVLMACRDVEKREFVGAGGIVDRGLLDGVAGIFQVNEIHALDDAAVLHVEAWGLCEASASKQPFFEKKEAAPA